MQDFEKAAHDVLTTYIEALNAQDSDAMRDWLDSHLKCNLKVFEESLGGRSIAEAFSGC